MSVQVKIPTVLRKHTDGNAAVEASGNTIGELLADVDRKFPGFVKEVCDEGGALHRFINVYLNDEDVRYLSSLETDVSDGDVVAILPAVAGG